MSLPSLDIGILLDFLQSAESSETEADVSSQLASLETLSAMCCDMKTIDYVRKVQGVQLIWNLCCKTSCLDVTHSSFFTLANIAQNNVFAQQDLCQKHVFSSLTVLLDAKETSLRTKTLVSYFLLSLISNNKQGQDLMLTSGCLKSLSSLYVQASEKLKDRNVSSMQVDFFKFSTKTLTYSVNLPKNVQNQNMVIEVLPWIVNGIHSSQRNKEITRLSCELLTMTIEDSESGQFTAIQCRAVEALILVINSLLPNVDDDCLGSSVTALNHVLCNAEEEEINKFLSFGGSSIMLKLIKKTPSNQWVVYHINQTLVLFLKCFQHHSKAFDFQYLHCVSQNLIKLMKIVFEDECFHKMSVQLLSLIMESSPMVASADEKAISLANKNNFASLSFSSSDMSSDFWGKGNQIILSKNINNSSSVLKPCDTTCLPQQAFTTILLSTERRANGELILDISKSSKNALRKSSGVNASPTDNVFPDPPNVSAITQDSSVDNSRILFKKPLLGFRNQRSGFRSKKIRQRHNSNRSFCPDVKRACVRYSTPKCQRLNGGRGLFGERSQLPNKLSCLDNDDVLSVCGDLIDREVLHSVKKKHGLKNFGTCGQLQKKLHL